jgi:hypothetical protein
MARSEIITAGTEAAKLHIKAFGIAPDETSQGYLQQRVGGKLGKFAAQIRSLEIHMKQLGWAGDEPQVSCALSVTLDGGGTLAVERSALGAREAFDHAMGVAERLVRQTLQRLRHR